jgi:hypothetical protein
MIDIGELQSALRGMGIMFTIPDTKLLMNSLGVPVVVRDGVPMVSQVGSSTVVYGGRQPPRPPSHLPPPPPYPPPHLESHQPPSRPPISPPNLTDVVPHVVPS